MPSVYPKDVLNGYKRVHKATCFVLMPFSPEFETIWMAICDTLQSQELNLICRRADDFQGT